jgi:Spy/CpxP family protein refolding chaperone
MKTARKHLMAVFEQEPFDKDTYQKAVMSLNNLHQNQVGKHMNLMADMAEYLSPKERKQLARMIMKRGERK